MTGQSETSSTRPPWRRGHTPAILGGLVLLLILALTTVMTGAADRSGS